MSTEQAVDRPDWTHPAVKKVEEDLKLVDRLLGGTRTMHHHSTDYVRKWSEENPALYEIRRQSEEVSGAYERTLSASVGMLFAKEPKIEWNDAAAIESAWANIDGAGTAGHVLVKQFAEKAINHGISVLLIDHTPTPKGVVVHAGNERELGLRPVWGYYPRTAIRSWRIAVIGGRPVLTQLVLKETGYDESGLYGARAYERYRVLRLENTGQGVGATFELIEKRETGGGNAVEWVSIESGAYRNRTGRIAPWIPVAIAHTGRSDAMLDSSMPLLPLAYANLHHWLRATNLRFFSDLTCFPQAVVIGDMAHDGIGSDGMPIPGKLRLGPGATVYLREGGDFKWETPSSDSWEFQSADLTARERRMAQLGMSFLAPDTRAAETAEAKRIDSTAENATLSTAAQGIDDAVNRAFEIHAWYEGLGPEQVPVFQTNRDFENTAMDADTMRAYVNAVKEAGLPPRMLLEAWQQGGRIGPDVDLEALEIEMMAGGMAQDRQEEQERREAAERVLEGAA